MQIELKTYTNPLNEKKETYYASQKQDQQYREYRRILGGMAWPYGIKPGFSVVIGEDRYKDRTVNKRHYHLLAEYESTDSMELIKKCFEMQGQYCVSFWYGHTKNEPMMEFVFELNKKRKKDEKGFYLSEAPHLEDPHALEFYVDTIKQRTIGTHKTLHLTEESRLPTYLMELTSDQMSKVRAETFPAIAALGYVISALSIYQPLDESQTDIMDEYFAQKDIDGL